MYLSFERLHEETCQLDIRFSQCLTRPEEEFLLFQLTVANRQLEYGPVLN